MKAQSPEIKRHPRFHSGSLIAALADVWQTNAHLKVTLDGTRKSIRFVYRFSLPKGISKKVGGADEVLFSYYREAIQNSVRNAVCPEGAHNPSIEQLMRLHHRAIKEGLRNWVTQMYASTLEISEKQQQEQAARFDAVSRKHTGPSGSRSLMVFRRAKKRSHSIRAAIKRLRGSYSPVGDRQSEHDLMKKLQNEKLRPKDVKYALAKCFGVQKMDTVRELFENNKISAAELAGNITYSEFSLDKQNPLKITLSTYRKRGGKLERALRECRGFVSEIDNPKPIQINESLEFAQNRSSAPEAVADDSSMAQSNNNNNRCTAPI